MYKIIFIYHSLK